MKAAFGLGSESLALAFSEALLLSAILDPWIAHLIDRGHGRLIMSSGALIGGIGLAALSCASQAWHVHACWLITHLLPLLQDRDIPPAAAVVASSCIGPMQVIGRIALMTLGSRYHPALAAACSLLATAIASLALSQSRHGLFLLMTFVASQGAGYGVLSIARPTLIARWLGAYRFGAVAGWLAVHHTAGYALPPLLAPC